MLKVSNSVLSSYIAFSQKFAANNDVNILMDKISKIKSTPTYQKLKQQVFPDYTVE